MCKKLLSPESIIDLLGKETYLILVCFKQYIKKKN